ncbi:putative helicase SRCAP [Paratrimastix pyriformis]|uniref:Helicase SRCAP n=1 Tax=Paratrimastix pyriformis TaxID=342808 RepID=A0ABQ8USY7_9EUKA|nr:putative helicase SRCAP [Paratrimastix pyriformis]
MVSRRTRRRQGRADTSEEDEADGVEAEASGQVTCTRRGMTQRRRPKRAATRATPGAVADVDDDEEEGDGAEKHDHVDDARKKRARIVDDDGDDGSDEAAGVTTKSRLGGRGDDDDEDEDDDSSAGPAQPPRSRAQQRRKAARATTGSKRPRHSRSSSESAGETESSESASGEEEEEEEEEEAKPTDAEVMERDRAAMLRTLEEQSRQRRADTWARLRACNDYQLHRICATTEELRDLALPPGLPNMHSFPYVLNFGSPTQPDSAHPEARFASCGKVEALCRLLTECRAAGGRALVFSQMTRILDILEDVLSERLHMPYLRMDGSTPSGERLGLVDKFNSDPSIGAFLLSTRSGGIGINLTEANTVIFYDSDLNPQIDKQAEARAHRIGQTRPVKVYRLVSEDTIDEAILKLADYKTRLTERTLGDVPVENQESDSFQTMARMLGEMLNTTGTPDA